MFLVEKFQQFHAELSRLVARVSQGTWVFDGSGAEPADASPTAVGRKLFSLLERQALEAGREGGDVGVEVYKRAQYAMAALADEVFLNLDWAGRAAWREHLLEAKLFNSRRAGEELFERIDELLKDRDTIYAELARVYLMVLGLGFQGKYRGRPDAEQDVAAYRRRLFRFVFGREPHAVRGNEAIVPQAYTATRDERHAVELPYLRPWVLAFVLIIVGWIAGSQVLWHRALMNLRPLVERILTHDTETAPPVTVPSQEPVQSGGPLPSADQGRWGQRPSTQPSGGTL